MDGDEGLAPRVYRGDQVTLVLQGDDAVVVGDPAAIEAVMSGLAVPSQTGDDGDRRSVPTDVLAVLGTAVGVMGTAGQYFTPTADTLAKLEAGAEFLSSGHGDVAGQLRQAAGARHLAGPASFNQVSMAGSQALSIQMAMTTLALRAAIADVQRAVEEVDAKVEIVKALLEARKIGDVRGRYKYLRSQVDQLEATGRLSNADWDAVAALGPTLETDLESLRAFIAQRVSDAARGGAADDRVDALDRIEELHTDLELLVVAQASLYLWHVVRVQHTWDTESDHVADAVARARGRMLAQQTADAELFGQIRAIGESLTRIDPLEYHRFLSRRALEADVDDLNGILSSFAMHRGLDFEPIPAVIQPTAREAADAAKVAGRDLASSTATVTRDAAGWVRGRVRRRGAKEDSLALDAGARTPPVDDALDTQPALPQPPLGAEDF